MPGVYDPNFLRGAVGAMENLQMMMDNVMNYKWHYDLEIHMGKDNLGA